MYYQKYDLCCAVGKGASLKMPFPSGPLKNPGRYFEQFVKVGQSRYFEQFVKVGQSRYFE